MVCLGSDERVPCCLRSETAQNLKPLYPPRVVSGMNFTSQRMSLHSLTQILKRPLFANWRLANFARWVALRDGMRSLCHGRCRISNQTMRALFVLPFSNPPASALGLWDVGRGHGHGGSRVCSLEGSWVIFFTFLFLVICNNQNLHAK